MRRIVGIIVCASVLLFNLIGCSNNEEENQARAAYTQYLQAVEAGQVDKAVNFLAGYEQGSKADKMMLRGELAIALEYLKQQKVQVSTFELIDVQVNDNQADLTVKMPFSGEVKNKRISLVKEGDAWKVVNFGGIK